MSDVRHAVARVSCRGIGAGAVVEDGVREVVASQRVGAACAARASASTLATNVNDSTRTVVLNGVGVVVAGRGVGASVGAA